MSAPVLYVARFVPSYRRPVLERLNRRLDGRLVVCAGDPPRASSFASLAATDTPSYREIQLHNYWLWGERLLAQTFRDALKLDPAVVLAEESPRSLTLPLLLHSAKRRGAGTLLWGHFSSNNRPPSGRHPIDRFRLGLARSVDGCVCYTDDIAAILKPHVSQNRVFVAQNTLDTDVLFGLHDELAKEGRLAVRKRLNLAEGDPILIFVGRLVSAKGAHRLLDVYEKMRKRGPVTLLVIGSGPEEDSMRMRCKREDWKDIRFLGPLTALEASAPYLFAADLLLNPGYVGLSVCHAFALGLPIVSQESPRADIRYHSPEIAYLLPGQNGLLAPHGDTEGLVQAVRAVLANRKHYSEHAASYARTHLRIQEMVKGLVQAVRFAERMSAARPRKAIR